MLHRAVNKHLCKIFMLKITERPCGTFLSLVEKGFISPFQAIVWLVETRY